MTKGASGLRRAVRRMVVPPSGPRRHLAPGLSLDGFFETLKQHDVCYVVLRWFDALPEVGKGEDIDLLVADEDLAFVRTLMAARSGVQSTQKFDIYSVSGLPGSDFNGVPYYPPRFAMVILEDGEWLRDRYRVPKLQHHYDSLAYHALYHKGYASGLSDGTSPDEVRRSSDHNYESVLTKLGSRLGQPLHPTLDSLDCYMAARGLRPPLDTLERLEPRNPWIHRRFCADQPRVDDLWEGLAVFVLRDRAQAQVDVAVRELDREGFEVLDVVELDTAQQERVSQRLRGGNWAQGPWPVSGGKPAVYVIAYDIGAHLSRIEGNRAPNMRVQLAKEQVRAHLLDRVPAQLRYNPLHSSDNPRQALDYLEALGGPDVEVRLRPLVQRLVESCTFPFPVVRSLPGHGRRAQVAVVDHPIHGHSVCKLFRPGATRFFERELRARKDLCDLAEVPDLLESGERWLLTTLYGDDLSHIRRCLPGKKSAQLTRDASRALARFALALHERGLFLLDLSTRNVVTDPTTGLKILDFEFLQEYRESVLEARDSYTFRGVPAGARGYDVPDGTRPKKRVGGSAFRPAATGSSVESLLLPHRFLDARRRALVQLGWYLLMLLKQLYVSASTSMGATTWSRDLTIIGKGLSQRFGRSWCGGRGRPCNDR